jgi:hypothetical protein
MIGGGNSSLVNCIIADNEGYGLSIFPYYGGMPRVEFNLVFANTMGTVSTEYASPPLWGQVITTNANGDSCDTYYNIFADPMFVDAANGDYHLQEGSPCIDAGDPNEEPDPDGTVADIGAYYFPQPQASPNLPNAVVTSIKLYQNYPNPFNAQTTIPFEIASASRVLLQVYNISGQLVATLNDQVLSPGMHRAELDASSLASGVYLVRMAAGGWEQSQKIILLK